MVCLTVRVGYLGNAGCAVQYSRCYDIYCTSKVYVQYILL